MPRRGDNARMAGEKSPATFHFAPVGGFQDELQVKKGKITDELFHILYIRFC